MKTRGWLIYSCSAIVKRVLQNIYIKYMLQFIDIYFLCYNVFVLYHVNVKTFDHVTGGLIKNKTKKLVYLVI